MIGPHHWIRIFIIAVLYLLPFLPNASTFRVQNSNVALGCPQLETCTGTLVVEKNI